jgi:hypothetical protein
MSLIMRRPYLKDIGHKNLLNGGKNDMHQQANLCGLSGHCFNQDIFAYLLFACFLRGAKQRRSF